MTRKENCGRPEALNRLEQADALLLAAQLMLDDATAPANAGVAAMLAVQAGIAASDAACCARLGHRPRGQSHSEAVAQLASVVPGGKDMAKDLQRLLAKKDSSTYGIHFVSTGEANNLMKFAVRLVGKSRSVVEQ